jgi:hypothetical protein
MPRGRPLKKFESETTTWLIEQVLEAHRSFCFKDHCVSLWKTAERMRQWHQQPLTRTHIQRILSGQNHICKNDGKSLHPSDFQTILSRKKICLLDKKKSCDEFTVVYHDHRPKTTIQAKTLPGALQKFLQLPEAADVDLILSDQSQEITLFQAETSMTWAKRDGKDLFFHPYGLRLEVQRCVERKHLHLK